MREETTWILGVRIFQAEEAASAKTWDWAVPMQRRARRPLCLEGFRRGEGGGGGVGTERLLLQGLACQPKDFGFFSDGDEKPGGVLRRGVI